MQMIFGLAGLWLIATGIISLVIPNKRFGLDTRKKAIGGLVAGIVSIFIASALSPDGGQGKQEKATAEAQTCKGDMTKCVDNADFVNNSGHWTDVQHACEEAATSAAKYGDPKWPSWFGGGPFGSFRTGNDYVSKGIVVAIEPDAQFSNGFGAMEHMRVVCQYDLNAKKVLAVDANPR